MLAAPSTTGAAAVPSSTREDPVITASPADAGIYILSEGPVWDVETGLFWVDIEAGAVLSAPIAGGGRNAVALGEVDRIELGEQVGCAIPIGAGRILVALRSQLGIVAADGTLTRGSVLLPEGQRFNDGAVDPQGRLLVGSLWLGDGGGNGNVLLRLENDGSLTTIDDDLGLSNGVGWSPDGATFYSTDTDAGIIYRRDYGPDALGTREVFLTFEDGTWPDGMTVDADGNLWVAIWGGGGVRVFGSDGMPRAGAGISIDAPHSSSVAFAGEALDTVVVTSASRDLDAAERAALPHAGGLFLARAGARGMAPTPWREVPLP
jgi:sugar lactone lactonase YvrE